MVPVLWGVLCPRSQQTQEERTERGMMSEVHTGTRGAGRCLGASAKGPRLRSAPRPQQGGLPSLQGAPRAAKPRRLATVSRSHPSKRGQALRAAAYVQVGYSCVWSRVLATVEFPTLRSHRGSWIIPFCVCVLGRGCPMSCRRFTSSPDLSPQDTLSTALSCDNQKCLQTLPNVPWGAKLLPVENHWPGEWFSHLITHLNHLEATENYQSRPRKSTPRYGPEINEARPQKTVGLCSCRRIINS